MDPIAGKITKEEKNKATSRRKFFFMSFYSFSLVAE